LADAWYFTSQGQQQGPASAEELRRYAARGLLRPRDLTWKDGMRRWVPAYTIPEFGLRPPRPGAEDGAGDSDAAGASLGARAAIWLGVVGSLALVVVVVLVVRNVRPSVAEDWTRRLEPNTQYNPTVLLTAGQRTEVTVVGQGGTSVDLKVYDSVTRQLVAEDSGGFSDRRRVVWVPQATRLYRVSVENRHPNLSNTVKVSVRQSG
jgi:hypothetical protein